MKLKKLLWCMLQNYIFLQRRLADPMTMTMKYIYLNPTLYIQWRVNIACKVPNTKQNNVNGILQNYNGNYEY